jgi:DNA-binding NarL/FixJ family response regulator
MKTSFVVADDHTLFLEGLVALLQREPDFSVVGEASEGNTAISLVNELHPDILVLDIEMPGANGIEVAKQVSLSSPETRVIIVSMYSDEHYVIDTLQNNVSAYIVKTETGKTLVNAVREVLAGNRYLSPKIADRAINTYIDTKQTSASLVSKASKLSNRELEVLKLIVAGNRTAQIADTLCLSGRTIENHRSSIMKKLELDCLADLVVFAVRSGIADSYSQ